jgi:hypothetical protein
VRNCARCVPSRSGADLFAGNVSNVWLLVALSQNTNGTGPKFWILQTKYIVCDTASGPVRGIKSRHYDSKRNSKIQG